ncbi:MAG: hypothetical protein JOZ69_01775, partial [Myxococcales bacterium]|nr:hypothetical protein [Myxococcales bacterium]
MNRGRVPLNALIAALGGGALTMLSPAPASALSYLPSVLTRGYNVARTGENTEEFLLTPSNVNTLKNTMTLPTQAEKNIGIVLDQTYAQPLYVPQVSINNQFNFVNVVVVADMSNRISVFDADSGNFYWAVQYDGAPITTANVARDNSGKTCRNFSGNLGIVGTPAIVPGSNGSYTIYFMTRSLSGGSLHYTMISADLATGHLIHFTPLDYNSTSVAGSGPGSVNGSLPFDPFVENQRAALLAANGQIYVAFGSYCDNGNWHGWLLSYDQSTLALTGTFCSTPNGSAGGIWMSGAGPAQDPSGDVWVSTGNGSWDGVTEYGDALLQFAPPPASLSSPLARF